MKLTKKQSGDLVKACINNDRIAQQALYKLYYADMLRVCNSYLPDKEAAREAFNSGFLKVFQGMKNFDPEKGGLGGWIRKIMIAAAIDVCRKELKFNHVAIDLPEEDEPFLSPEALEKLYFEDLVQHIRALPYATQTVFNLSVIDGFSHKEIGEQLNISEGTSRWHLSEAKKLLRGLLETGNGLTKEGRGEKK